MKNIRLCILSLFIAAPLYGQGLTISMRETGPTGQSAPVLQTDRTNAKLDIPSLASQVLYDSTSSTLRLLVPLLKTYREYTPATISSAATAGRGQPVPARIMYKRTGSGKVRDWSCTTYEGFRGADKVVEVCAAEGNAIALQRADFALVERAIEMVKGVAPPELIERVPLYSTVESQGFAGFPVRRVSFRAGQPEITTELVEIKREAVPAANFAVPAGFTKAQ